ncbi:DUF2187 family protein [Bacillus sp. ISL-47]|uniref:DUF2187 family protein n=1 Tax=Bacillus sp. ISL-47 TaxID=2819130 RepID=UPI001BE5A3B3|nr:DUF2187 family protein [Bacillus sp. ISL-47]MBT2689658.1 DUF2187 family protein [Bacillus sp. ISL-47]MBT2709303.1 DUF2187 family protein [Pseudomonas sp. ISL-84]
MTKKTASIGDRISFQRKEITIEGVVGAVRDNSVIVEISMESSQRLHYDTTKTVVKHSNYAVLPSGTS